MSKESREIIKEVTYLYPVEGVEDKLLALRKMAKEELRQFNEVRHIITGNRRSGKLEKGRKVLEKNFNDICEAIMIWKSEKKLFTA